MSRNRMIRKEFFSDEKVARLSVEARLLFISMWIQADDRGKGRAAPAFLRAVTFPYDSNIALEKVGDCLKEIATQRLAAFYEVERERYYLVINFLRHQVINRPSSFEFPDPPQRVLREYSRRAPRSLLDERERRKEKGKKKIKPEARVERKGIGEPSSKVKGKEEQRKIQSTILRQQQVPVSIQQSPAHSKTKAPPEAWQLVRLIADEVPERFRLESGSKFEAALRDFWLTLVYNCVGEPPDAAVFRKQLLEYCTSEGIDYPQSLYEVPNVPPMSSLKEQSGKHVV